jgi:YVTN family beta-propeller protein
MKTKINGLRIASIYLFFVGLLACDSTPLPDVDPSPTVLRGVFILNQGGFNQNDAGLSFYDPETRNVSTVAMNKPQSDEIEPLGDLGQDLLLYGSKLYISVNGSNYIRVLDVESKRTIKKIAMEDADKRPLNPRYMAAYDGKIFVTCWTGNSVVRIDTTTLAPNGSVTVGSYPEGIAACGYNGKLYVANSGAMTGHTVSVIDIASFQPEAEITVGLNPNLVKATRENFVYVNYLGDYGDTPGGFQRINLAANNAVTTLGTYPKNDFVWDEWTVYYYDSTYGTSGPPTISYGTFKINDDSYSHPSKLIENESLLKTPYGIGLDPVGKTLYLADAEDFTNPGKVYVFDAQGKYVHDFSAGIVPSKFAFY